MLIGARVKIVLATALALGAAAIAITLVQAPVTVARINNPRSTPIAGFKETTTICQSGEVLPRQTTAIRLRASTFLGPRVTVELEAHGHVLAHGEQPSGWTGGAVTVPVNSLPTTISGVELCFTLYLNGDEGSAISGEPTSEARAARVQAAALSGRVLVEYLRPGRSSWWSIAPEVARRMGLGHAWGGTWIVLVVLALMAGLVALCSRLVVRELR